MAAKPVNVTPVTVYLTHLQFKRLQKLKDETGAPTSELIRRAIDQYLKATDSKR